jgi:RNA polymerase sigma factor (sigma-70 family)
VTQQGFEGFWSRERDRLYRVLSVGLDDPELAAEAVDEAMARALQRWDRVSRYDDPAGWVFRVARNWATSWHRKWSRRPSLRTVELDQPEEASFPDIDVQRALGALNEMQRTVLALRFHLDWPVDRIAEALDVPPGTVKSRLHRALRDLGEREEVTR